MLDDDKAKARKADIPISRMPPLPLASDAIKRIAKRGQESPFNLSPSEVYQLCNAVVAATRK